jgi:hypothetical protein
MRKVLTFLMVRENIMIISGSKGGYPEGAKSKSLLLTQEKEMKANLVFGSNNLQL